MEVISLRMKDKVAIVTGGGKGIGRAISLAFAAEGAIVVMAARDLSSTKDTVKEIESLGGRADAVMTDVRYEDQIRNMAAHVLSKFGRTDVLVNNSGIAGPTINLVDIDLKDWNDVMATNLTGAMLCAREVMKSMMAARKGSIINISSEGGRSG